MKNEGQKLSIGEIGKKCGELWREMSSEDKAEYEEKAAEDKKRYEAENAKWLAEGGAEAIKAQKKTAKAAKKQAAGGGATKSKSSSAPKKAPPNRNRHLR